MSPPPHADRFRDCLPAGLPPALVAPTLTLLERFHDAQPGAALDEALARVFAISPFTAECAIAEPQALAALRTDAADARSRADYDALIDAAFAALEDPAADLAASMAAAKRALRGLRRREMMRIAWRDIHLGVSADIVMQELSTFADSVVAGSVRWLGDQLAPRFGRPHGDDGRPLELCVIGMGKLGGHELNFSSDIDLIFVYGEAGSTRGGRRELDHQDYFDRLGRELIALLNETTAEGFVFRVDMRLRPFGDSGPLTASLAALEHYYAAHGRDWERYALIKGRALTGDEATRARLAAITRPFIYRRYLDYGALEALREMKRLINRESGAAALAGDVKRGPGGIREIEFTGQLFQLTRGGREPRLRGHSLMATLDACVDLGLLEGDEVATLKTAYAFLRTTEHRLQQVHDWQTHALPQDDAERARLAYAMGSTDYDSFLRDLDAHRDATRTLFASLLEAPGVADGVGSQADSADGGEALRAHLAAAWIGDGDGDGAALVSALAAHGVELEPAIAEALASLRSERALSRLSRAGRERLDRLMPLLLKHVVDSDTTTAGARRGVSVETVNRIVALLHAVTGRSVYLAFLADNPAALGRVLELFAASPWIARQITAHPLLLDELLDPRVLFNPPDAARLKELAASQIRADDGLEQAMDQLRSFRDQQMLRVAASDITGHLPLAQVSDQLTWIAEACIDRALALAWNDLTRRFGEPRCSVDGVERTVGFAVIGYGKLGGWELGYGSDLDLVFLNDSGGERQQTAGPKVIENGVFFARLVQRFIHVMSTNTPAGVAYEIDTRLRPSGSAGMLASSTDAYRRYLDGDAWTWELQALVRARGVAGDAAVLESFAAIRAEVLSREHEREALIAAVTDMRARMLGELDRGNAELFDLKQGIGGMTDIEFMVQYAVLAWAHEHPELTTWSDNLRLLEIIARLALIEPVTCEVLREAYFAYRADGHRQALADDPVLVPVAQHAGYRARVAAAWENLFGQSGATRAAASGGHAP